MMNTLSDALRKSWRQSPPITVSPVSSSTSTSPATTRGRSTTTPATSSLLGALLRHRLSLSRGRSSRMQQPYLNTPLNSFAVISSVRNALRKESYSYANRSNCSNDNTACLSPCQLSCIGCQLHARPLRASSNPALEKSGRTEQKQQ